MTEKEAENFLEKLNEYLNKYQTMMDYIWREDHIVWTQEAEDKAISEYMQLKNKLIELLCR